jgi:homoserine kinase
MNSEESVSAFAPATVANLGPGFDILGLALSGPGDTVTARRVSGHGVRLAAIEGDGGRLSLDPLTNTAAVAATATLRRAGLDMAVELTLRKGLPIGSGLGSSAASAAAAAFAVNLLAGAPLRRADLVGPCLEAEEAVSGRHADNVAPALLGGLLLVRSLDPLDLVRLPVPPELRVVVATPEHEVSTRDARAAMPAQVPLADAVRTSANLAALVSACHSGDIALLGRSLVDSVATPARLPLIPGARAVLAAALDAGALGSGISGSGPTLFALCRSDRSAREAAAAMRDAFARAGLRSTTATSPADCPGARRV